jgi:hypothetical protein
MPREGDHFGGPRDVGVQAGRRSGSRSTRLAVDGRWNADVRMRRILTQDRPHVERATCYKLSAEQAERAGEIWARRWVDLNNE